MKRVLLCAGRKTSKTEFTKSTEDAEWKPFPCIHERLEIIGTKRGAEFDNALLGPEALASGMFRNKGTMATVLRRDKLDDGILADFCG